MRNLTFDLFTTYYLYVWLCSSSAVNVRVCMHERHFYVKLSERYDATIISVADVIRSYRLFRPETSRRVVRVFLPSSSSFSPFPILLIPSRSSRWSRTTDMSRPCSDQSLTLQDRRFALLTFKTWRHSYVVGRRRR